MLWITGSKGLLGSALVEECKAALHPFIGTGREADITQKDQIEKFLDMHPIEKIVNAAAFSHVDRAEEKREEAYLVNALAPEYLADIASQRNIEFIHISTDYVFSSLDPKPLKETDPTNPCNFYGKTKLEGEQRVLAKGKTVIRISGLFGKKRGELCFKAFPNVSSAGKNLSHQ